MTGGTPKRIGIAGAHSTGKSTFVQALVDRAYMRDLRAHRIGDLGQQARDLGFPILRCHTFESTAWIMAQGLAYELNKERSCDLLIVDRPMVDALGYYIAALEHRGEADHEGLDRLTAFCRQFMPRFDVVCVTRIDPNVPLGVEKKRDQDLEFRQRAASGIVTALTTCRIDPHYLPVNASADEAEALLKQLFESHAEGAVPETGPMVSRMVRCAAVSGDSIATARDEEMPATTEAYHQKC